MGSLIHYQNVVVQRAENIILKDVSFELSQGEFLYVVGKVGSGKSSLLKTIYAEVPIVEGEAKVLDFNLYRIPSKKIPYLRRNLGIVFQDFQLLMDRSVNANLDFVLRATGWRKKGEREERVVASLNMVGLETKGYKMPHELSGGEQQRVAIARALLNSPQIILADEPTGNLDIETGKQIVELLHKISQMGTAVLMVTHNRDFVQQYEGKVLRCEGGLLVEEGR
ncbi:MAG TPA: phosphonate ABC transporter ATP-binding protein [Porphyromonadaceae bacterium]|nr:phosphonate ABC transporter ATP-binding protein [Porphyromonadaceae bacterium]